MYHHAECEFVERDLLFSAFLDCSGAELGGRSRRVLRGDPLYIAGDSARSIFLVESGSFKRTVSTWDGRHAVIDINVGPDLIGEAGLSGDIRSDSATAHSDGVARSIGRDEFFETISRRGLLRTWTRFLGRRARLHESTISQFVTLDSERRLAARLLQLGCAAGSCRDARGYSPLLERLTHADLAAMVGTTRSRIGFFLQKFERTGLIERRDGLLMIGFDGLTRYVGQADPVLSDTGSARSRSAPVNHGASRSA